MRNHAAAALCLALLTAPAWADSYGNARYGYLLDYPAGLFAPQPEADSGDGRHFTALKGGADLAVWANYNAQEDSPSAIADTAAGDCLASPAPYRVVRATLVVVSCRTAKGILYHKTLISDDLLATFELTYPQAERARWDAVVPRLKLTLPK